MTTPDQRQRRQRTAQLIEAGVLPLVYLLFAVPVILSCAGQNVWLQWYPAAFVTMPVSLVLEGSDPPGLFGYLFFALLNAVGLFIPCDAIVQAWARRNGQGVTPPFPPDKAA
jgi:hypothetical protein